jgi:hypothetical protein
MTEESSSCSTTRASYVKKKTARNKLDHRPILFLRMHFPQAFCAVKFRQHVYVTNIPPENTEMLSYLLAVGLELTEIGRCYNVKHVHQVAGCHVDKRISIGSRCGSIIASKPILRGCGLALKES